MSTVVQFTTLSGSVYQVDAANKQARRIFGFHPVTGRQSEDGVWQFFHSFEPDPLERGRYVLFVWDDEGHGTATSIVTKVEEVEVPDHVSGEG
jgi:hypothetical protein